MPAVLPQPREPPMSAAQTISSRQLAMAALVMVSLAASTRADINLEWRPTHAVATVGAEVGLGLYAVSDAPHDQFFSAVQAIIAWDPNHLRLIGTDQTGGIGLFSAGFMPDDAFGLNEACPPADGDGLWAGLAFPSVLPATPDGSLLATMIFEALLPVDETGVAILPSAGDPLGYTKVIGDVPGLNVLGHIGPPVSVAIVPEPGGLGLFMVALLAVQGARRRRRTNGADSSEASAC